jgi:hypothetical protein
MKGPALLDINLLVALFDPDHVHHELAHDWFADNRARGWATCPITENGFVRVLSNPGYGGPITRVTELTARLRRFCASGFHLFWPDNVSIRDEATFRPELIGGHRQLTDVYLLGLAWRHEGTLATFDHRMSEKVIAAPAGSVLEVIAPLDAGRRRT